MEAEFGRGKAERGISWAIEDPARGADKKSREFPPTPGDFREYVQLAVDPDAPALSKPVEDCGFCDGTGFESRPLEGASLQRAIDFYGEEKARKIRESKTCHCRRMG